MIATLYRATETEPTGSPSGKFIVTNVYRRVRVEIEAQKRGCSHTIVKR